MLSWTYGGSRKRRKIYGIDIRYAWTCEGLNATIHNCGNGGDGPVSSLNELYTRISKRLAFNGIGLAILLLD